MSLPSAVIGRERVDRWHNSFGLRENRRQYRGSRTLGRGITALRMRDVCVNVIGEEYVDREAEKGQLFGSVQARFQTSRWNRPRR